MSKKIFGNIASLSLLQLANYVFPFLTVPYLSRVLSTSHYGLILFSLSFTTYFAILCDYGFGLTGTKAVATNANQPEQLNRLVSSITFIKSVLFIFSLILNLIIVFSYSQFREYWFIYVINIFTLINSIFFPTWFFQGMERMKHITLVQVAVRSLAVVLILCIVKHDSDYYLWPVINLLTTIIGVIIVQYFLFRNFNLRYVKPDWQSIKRELSEGWHVFISTVAISLYTISNSFFLGIMTSATMVAYYASGEKIMNAVQGLLGPVSQALYPHLTKIVHNDKSKGIKAIQQALFRIAGVGLVISIGLFVAAPVIVRLLFGVKYQIATTEVVRILSVLPFIICLSNIFGIQTMLPFGLTKPFSRILIISSILNVVLLLILIPRYSYVGTAISVVITEVSVTSMMLFYLFKNGIYVWRGKLISKGVNYG